MSLHRADWPNAHDAIFCLCRGAVFTLGELSYLRLRLFPLVGGSFRWAVFPEKCRHALTQINPALCGLMPVPVDQFMPSTNRERQNQFWPLNGF